jgi:translation elongation factor EF-4
VINQDDVREAEALAVELQRKLRELYVQAAIETPQEFVDRDAKMTMCGMMRGIHDFLNYCRSGE